jgi:hypothetical protein
MATVDAVAGEHVTWIRCDRCQREVPPQHSAAEFAEASRLLADLLAIREQLKPGDRRFAEMRQRWLEREGKAARLGSCRMEIIRRVHRMYFPAAGELPAAV